MQTLTDTKLDELKRLKRARQIAWVLEKQAPGSVIPGAYQRITNEIVTRFGREYL